MPMTPRCQAASSRTRQAARPPGAVAHGFDAGFDVAEGFGFDGAAVVVEAVEFFGEEAGGGGVAGEEHFDDVGGDVHAAGGVDAGGEAEADVGGGDGEGGVDLREFHEGAEAGLGGLLQLAEAERGDDAVFAGEGDGVGDGGDGEQLEEGGEGLFAEAVASFGRRGRRFRGAPARV